MSAGVSGAQAEADQLLRQANANAERYTRQATAEAEEKAGRIVRQAQQEAQLEKDRARDDMKREIVDVSTQLAGKILSREIDAADHRALIDSVLQKIGDEDGAEHE